MPTNPTPEQLIAEARKYSCFARLPRGCQDTFPGDLEEWCAGCLAHGLADALDFAGLRMQSYEAEIASRSVDYASALQRIQELTSEVLHQRDRVEEMARRADRFLGRAEKAERKIQELT